MTATNFLETNILKLLFNGLPITGLAMNNTTAPVTNFYLSLHSADPTEGGTQSLFEVNYTNYSRPSISRDGSGWTVGNNTVSNSDVLDFPTSQGGTSTATHFGIGTDPTGEGVLLFKGSLLSSIEITPNTTPSFNAGNLIVTVE